MNGLNPQEVKELIEYIQENNSWEHLYDCCQKGRKVPKYYDMTFDTRTGDMWSIRFRQITGGGHNRKDKIFLRTENGYSLKDKIYEWLNETSK